MSDMLENSGGKIVVVIAGPTASGKSALALQLAERAGGVIINADASQVYRDLAILSARPTAAEETRAPHLLFGYLDAAEAGSAARWAAAAGAALDEAHRQGRLPIVVGGTGLYLRALLSGMAALPEIDATLRAAIRAMASERLRAALEAEDPRMAARLHPNDRQRNARALEVIRSTGRSLADWQRQAGSALSPAMRLRPLLLDRPADELDQRIAARIGRMWADGALDEVRKLRRRHLPAGLPIMRAIGVPPLLSLLDGECSTTEALQRWRLDTRRYAKRQRTWFRNQTPGWPRAPIPESESDWRRIFDRLVQE